MLHRLCRRHLMRFYAPLVVALGFVACGPSETRVREEFLAANPDATIVSQAPGEGDGDNVYVHIRYTTAGNSAVQEDVWLYQDLPEAG